MTKIVAIANNNSDARNLNGYRGIPGAASCRHNGGKTLVILTDDTESTESWLDDDRRIASYKTESGE